MFFVFFFFFFFFFFVIFISFKTFWVNLNFRFFCVFFSFFKKEKKLERNNGKLRQGTITDKKGIGETHNSSHNFGESPLIEPQQAKEPKDNPVKE